MTINHRHLDFHHRQDHLHYYLFKLRNEMQNINRPEQMRNNKLELNSLTSVTKRINGLFNIVGNFTAVGGHEYVTAMISQQKFDVVTDDVISSLTDDGYDGKWNVNLSQDESARSSQSSQASSNSSVFPPPFLCATVIN